MMELISTDDHYILHQLVQCEHALWISRHTGEFSVHASWDLAQESNPECLGATWGLVGKLKIHPQMEEQLVLIRECERILDLPDASLNTTYPVYRVKNVVLLPISPNPTMLDPPLKSCPKHHIGIVDPTTGLATQAADTQSKFPFKSLGGKFKLAGETLKSTAGSVAGGITNQVKVPWKKDREGGLGGKDLEKLEKKLIDEILKIFNDSQGFYFSYTGDLTNSLQRQHEYQELNKGLPVWRRVDDRFFFNKALLREVIELQDTRAEGWILPLIQGFIEIKECNIDMVLLEELGADSKLPPFYRLCIISRRAHARAGTRYKRRGVDEEGKVANYVETEQIVLYHTYALSFMQIRGSIPIFWSQPGLKYRPPPRIDRNETENQTAFSKHFLEQIEMYGPVTCVSLVDRNGREKILSDVFLENIIAFNEPDVAFVSFDFHEYCRGMKFENVSILLDNIQEVIHRMGYFWVDSHGKVCGQKGVFRINCVDCLDRTNVVQTAIARTMLEVQLTKLGVVQPEHGLSQTCKANFQSLWANNGDIISRQYAGTNALKGDYTRTGERNLSGLVKDGVNSASRYYLNHIRDSYRQAAIDVLVGKEVSEDLFKTEKGIIDEVDNSNNADHVKTVIEDCKKQLTQEHDQIIGSWGLIDADMVTGDPSQEGLDIVFILTQSCYYFARYDDDLDKITDYEKVELSEIVKIEFGIPEQTLSFLNKTEVHCFRIMYRVGGEEGYHHMCRSTNLRFFNNVATDIKSEDEKVESLKAIADTVAVTMESSGFVPNMWFGKLEKRRSKSSKSTTLLNPVDMLNLARPKSPIKLRNVGSKALSNVTSHFSKLNPISRMKKESPREFTDIRQEIIEDTGVEAFEDGAVYNENTHYVNTLHLPSSGLLMKTNASSTYGGQDNLEDQVNLSIHNSSITYSKNQSIYDPSQYSAPGITLTEESSHNSPVAEKYPQSTSNLMPQRTRKLSRSSEEIGPNTKKPLGNVLMPLGKLARGLQNFGNNLDNKFAQTDTKLSGLSEQYVSIVQAAPRLSPKVQDRPQTAPNDNQTTFSSDVQRKIEESSCQSLIITI